MSKEIESAVNAFLANPAGVEGALPPTDVITYSAIYMGETAKDWSGDSKPNIMDQWQVKFRRGQKEISEFYFTGLGHRKVTSKFSLKDERRNYARHSIGYAAWSKEYMKPVKPEAASVLYSLLMDASAMHESFNDWCDNYGYSSDSITAFRTYQDCCEIGKKLCQIFTKEESDKLREMLQDY